MDSRLHTVVLDTADIAGLASFYGRLAGLKQHHVEDDWITMVTEQGYRLGFQLAPDHVPPQWPDQAHPQQFHLDFQVPDLSAAVQQAIALGARQLPGGSGTYTVLADPAGHPFCLCANDSVTGVTLADVALDVPDAAAIAPFYAELLGMQVTYSGPEGAMLAADGELPLMFQNVANYQPPRWPDPAHPQQLHLDVKVPQIDAAEEAVLKLGATKLAEPGEGNFRVYADPAGHPFCLVWDE